MISMENWLDQLDENIAQTNDTGQKLELLHAKLEILDDLVALHKKYQPQGQLSAI
jgi:CRISPR/Cas system CSM-associated protein Csm2 small subunit